MRTRHRLRLLTTVIALTAGFSRVQGATWNDAITADWTVGSAWTPTGIPNGAGVDATIAASGNAYSVDLLSTSITLSNLSISSANATLVVYNSSNLTVLSSLNLQAGAMTIGNAGQVTASIAGSGSLDLLDGILNASTLFLGATIDGSYYGGTITNGLNLASGGSLSFSQLHDTSDMPKLQFKGNQTLSGSGTVYFDQSSGGLVYASGGNLTVSPGISITTRNGNGTVGSPSNGTIINQGLIEATAGHTLTMDGIWTNQGTLEVNGGTLSLAGSFKTADMGTIVRSGGTITINGAVDNTASIFAPSAATGDILLGNNGEIDGGIVQPAVGTSLTSNYGLLSNVTIAGIVNATYLKIRNVSFSSGGEIRVYAGRLDIGTGPYGTDAETVSGSGVIHLESGSIYDGNASVVLGAGITMLGDSGRNTLELANGFTNHGTITASGANTTVVIQNNSTSTYFALPWQNQGLLTANSGGTLVLMGEIPVGGLGSFDSTGGSVIIGQKLFNTGNTLVLDGAKNILTVNALLIGGTVTAKNGAFVQVTGSSIFVPQFQDVTLDTDLYLGANVDPSITANTTFTSGHTLYFGTNATLTTDGTLNGNATVLFEAGTDSISPNSFFFNDLVIGAGMTIKTDTGSGRIAVNDPNKHVYTNNGTILSESPGYSMTIGTSIANNTMFNGGLMRVTNASLQINSTLTNTGTIDAQNAVLGLGSITSNSGTIAIQNSNVTISGVPATSFGNFSMNGGMLSYGVASSTIGFLRALTISNTAITLTAGIFDNTGTTLPVQENGNTYALGNVTISGGTIVSAANVALSILGNATLSNVALNSDIAISSNVTLHLGGTTETSHLISLPAAGVLELAAPALTNSTTTIRFDGTTTGSSLRAPAGQSLTVPAGVTVKTGSGGGTIGTASVLTLILGTVTADTAGITFLGQVHNSGTLTFFQDSYVGPYTGNPTTAHSLTNDGEMELSPNADVFVSAPFSQTSNGTLEIEISGVGAELSGELAAQTMTLGGTLKIDLVPGYVPALGSVYTLLTSNAITGAFSAYDLPVLPSGLAWSETYSATSLVLKAVPEPSSIGFWVGSLLLLRRRGKVRAKLPRHEE